MGMKRKYEITVFKTREDYPLNGIKSRWFNSQREAFKWEAQMKRQMGKNIIVNRRTFNAFETGLYI